MKLMIASDIHGTAYWCKKMLEAFEQNGAEKLILLGDILYHGPRNDLPEEYAPKQVIAMLNPLKDKLLCVRGNCDTEVDQMVLDFPVMAEYAYICCDGLRIFATHGQIQLRQYATTFKGRYSSSRSYSCAGNKRSGRLHLHKSGFSIYPERKFSKQLSDTGKRQVHIR